jgi:hypothetical protein
MQGEESRETNTTEVNAIVALLLILSTECGNEGKRMGDELLAAVSNAMRNQIQKRADAICGPIGVEVLASPDLSCLRRVLDEIYTQCHSARRLAAIERRHDLEIAQRLIQDYVALALLAPPPIPADTSAR